MNKALILLNPGKNRFVRGRAAPLSFSVIQRRKPRAEVESAVKSEVVSSATLLIRGRFAGARDGRGG